MKKKEEQTVRVLQVLGGTGLGGAESRVMDLYRSIDRTRIQFDFAVHTTQKGFFDDEIRALGGNIYALPRFQGYNLFAYRKAWKRFFAEHAGYAFVHGHMTSTASVYLPLAKQAGVPVTAAHARSAGVDGGLKGILTRLMRLPLWKRTDYCLAASGLAGEAVFGKKAVEQGKVIVLPNAISASKYAYDPEKREKLRAELGVGNAFVIGHVGRFHPCKNHAFLIEIFGKVCEKKPDSRLLLLGEGSGMESIRQKACELGVEDRILFLGNRANVQDYYQAMDMFVFPSFYEGLPGTVLEAQTAGLPCLISDRITQEVCVTGLVKRLALEADAQLWAEEALEASEAVSRKSRLEEIRESGFDTERQAALMQRFYETGRLPEELVGREAD